MYRQVVDKILHQHVVYGDVWARDCESRSAESAEYIDLTFYMTKLFLMYLVVYTLLVI